jgi:putative tryptophan/tyrosine transport system substrate-binding protein
VTQVRGQRTEAACQRGEIPSRDVGCSWLFLWLVCGSVVNSIADLRVAISILCALLFALCPFRNAQSLNLQRIGYLSASSRSEAAPRTQAFRQGLRDLGYVEGKNLALEFRFADGNFDRIPDLVSELIRLNVAIIVTAGPSLTGPVKQATTTIPIVMTNDSDPVGSGFVSSLARPGGNITGLTGLARELSGKRLELLKEILPKLSRAAILGISDIPGNARALRETELAAAGIGVQTQYLDIRAAKDIEPAFGAAVRWRADAVSVLNGPPHIQRLIPDIAAKNRIPAMYFNPEIIERDAGLLSYGASLSDLDRRAAAYVHRILKGAKPADLPIEQPTKFELVINLKTAKQIGLTIPPHVLARRDRVIG